MTFKEKNVIFYILPNIVHYGYSVTFIFKMIDITYANYEKKRHSVIIIFFDKTVATEQFL